MGKKIKLLVIIMKLMDRKIYLMVKIIYYQTQIVLLMIKFKKKIGGRNKRKIIMFNLLSKRKNSYFK